MSPSVFGPDADPWWAQPRTRDPIAEELLAWSVGVCRWCWERDGHGWGCVVRIAAEALPPPPPQITAPAGAVLTIGGTRSVWW